MNAPILSPSHPMAARRSRRRRRRSSALADALGGVPDTPIVHLPDRAPYTVLR